MKSVKGTLTEKNLLKSFAGESQARNRYTFFASVAKKEGFEQIAGVFMETAEQEKEHAKRFFKYLEGGDLEITATYPAGKIGMRKKTQNLAVSRLEAEIFGIFSHPIVKKLGNLVDQKSRLRGIFLEFRHDKAHPFVILLVS